MQLGTSQNITLPNASNFIEFAKWTTDNEVINANMDEITIWDRALNEGHIQALMYGDSIFNQNGLEGYFEKKALAFFLASSNLFKATCDFRRSNSDFSSNDL